MPKIPDILIPKLSPLASQVGGLEPLTYLSSETILAAGSFEEEVMAIGPNNVVFVIPDMDLTKGYEVYSKNYDKLYTLNALAENWFGQVLLDELLISRSAVSDYFYLCYHSVDLQEPRAIMLVRVP